MTPAQVEQILERHAEVSQLLKTMSPGECAGVLVNLIKHLQKITEAANSKAPASALVPALASATYGVGKVSEALIVGLGVDVDTSAQSAMNAVLDHLQSNIRPPGWTAKCGRCGATWPGSAIKCPECSK